MLLANLGSCTTALVECLQLTWAVTSIIYSQPTTVCQQTAMEKYLRLLTSVIFVTKIKTRTRNIGRFQKLELEL